MYSRIGNTSSYVGSGNGFVQWDLSLMGGTKIWIVPARSNAEAVVPVKSNRVRQVCVSKSKSVKGTMPSP